MRRPAEKASSAIRRAHAAESLLVSCAGMLVGGSRIQLSTAPTSLLFPANDKGLRLCSTLGTDITGKRSPCPFRNLSGIIQPASRIAPGA